VGKQLNFDLDRGQLLGFDGRPVRHSREKPPGLRRVSESYCDNLLPFDAWQRGWQLLELTAEHDADPFVLYDQWGHILHQWPDDYTPSLAEVRDVCRRLYG